MAKAEDEQAKMEEEFGKTKEALEHMEKKYKLLEERLVEVEKQKDDLAGNLTVRQRNYSVLYPL